MKGYIKDCGCRIGDTWDGWGRDVKFIDSSGCKYEEALAECAKLRDKVEQLMKENTTMNNIILMYRRDFLDATENT